MRIPLLPSLCLAAGLAACPALAEDKPATQPAPKSELRPGGPREGLVDAAFLGLVTESIPLERAGDLGLPPGTGLSVATVAPGSPAEKAGFQRHDVLTKLDEHLLVNPAQLRVLVRLKKGGDTVAVQVVRKGKPVAIKAELATRPMPELTPGGEEPRELQPGGGLRFNIPRGEMPPEFRRQLERLHRGIGPAPKDLPEDEADDDKDEDGDKGPHKAGQSF